MGPSAGSIGAGSAMVPDRWDLSLEFFHHLNIEHFWVGDRRLRCFVTASGHLALAKRRLPPRTALRRPSSDMI